MKTTELQIEPFYFNHPDGTEGMGYYDRYLRNIEQSGTRLHVWMGFHHWCLPLGDYVLVYQKKKDYTRYPLNQTPLHVWIEYKTTRIGEMTLEFNEEQQSAYIHLIKLEEPYRYQRHGTRLVKELFKFLMLRLFHTKEATIQGIATPIEGQGFWKRCAVQFQEPIKGEPQELDGEMVHYIKGYPFVFDFESYQRLLS